MYQYTATLKRTKEVVATAHSLPDIEKEITRYIQLHKSVELDGIIVIHHNQRNKLTGQYIKKLIKEVII